MKTRTLVLACIAVYTACVRVDQEPDQVQEDYEKSRDTSHVAVQSESFNGPTKPEGEATVEKRELEPIDESTEEEQDEEDENMSSMAETAMNRAHVMIQIGHQNTSYYSRRRGCWGPDHCGGVPADIKVKDSSGISFWFHWQGFVADQCSQTQYDRLQRDQLRATWIQIEYYNYDAIWVDRFSTARRRYTWGRTGGNGWCISGEKADRFPYTDGRCYFQLRAHVNGGVTGWYYA